MCQTNNSLNCNNTKRHDAARLIADLTALANTVKSSTGTSEQNKLPASFQPGPLDVICGRGKRAYDHNEHFRDLVAEYLERYGAASSKVEKTLIVSEIIDRVREQSPSGGFIRSEGKSYFEVGDSISREKVGGTIRDLLHNKYKSSNKARKRRREEEEDTTEIKTTVVKRERKSSIPESVIIPNQTHSVSVSVFGQFFTDIAIPVEEDRTPEFPMPEPVTSNEYRDLPFDICHSFDTEDHHDELDAVDAALLQIANTPFEWGRQSFIMIRPESV